MNKNQNPTIDLAQANLLLAQWRKKHDTPAKVVAAHRKVLLKRVSQSMAFENQPVSMERLKKPGESKERPLSSTRTFETAEEALTHTELSERLAVPLIALHDEILHSHPDHLSLTTEWPCQCHKRLAGHLFPDWAGRYRDG